LTFDLFCHISPAKTYCQPNKPIISQNSQPATSQPASLPTEFSAQFGQT